MLEHLEWKDTFKELAASANMPSYDNFYRGSGRASESHEVAKIKPFAREGEKAHFSSNRRDYLLFQGENRRARNRIKRARSSGKTRRRGATGNGIRDIYLFTHPL